MWLTIRSILKLLRVEHYVKNALCFLPLIFHGKVLQGDFFWKTLLGTATFCALSSCVYIYNDIRDIDLDRNHPHKRFRPLPSGRLSVSAAWTIWAGTAVSVLVFGYCATGFAWVPWSLLGMYAASNLLYSHWLKHVVLVDVGILASGFLLRLFYGSELTSISLSIWMFLTILSASLFMGLGKRRNEMLCENSGKVRSVLSGYTWNFLDRNMYLMMALTIVFYALWTISYSSFSRKNLALTPLVWTVPGVIFILMRYSLVIERGVEGDPIRVMFGDRVLLLMSVLLGIALIVLQSYYPG